MPKPLAVSENTFVIRGKNDTYLGFAFGDERQAHQVNLYDYLPADRVLHLGNYVLDLICLLPGTIGVDRRVLFDSPISPPNAAATAQI